MEDFHGQETLAMLYIFCFWIKGTAGVWRIAALEEAGGWKDRTTVEDMDLAVRATLCGWKFIFVGSIKVMISLLCIWMLDLFQNSAHHDAM